MKKRILSICIMTCMLVMSLFAFSGCNLYHDNNKRVNEEVVAMVGEEKITRNDLNTWFNYYYYSSGLYYQYSEEEVYEMALTNLIKFKLIINEAKHTEGIVLSISDQNKIWEQVFDYIDQTLDEYENSIRERFGLDIEVKEPEEEEEEGTKFEEYKRAEKNYSIDYDQNDTVLNNVYAVPTVEGDYYRYLAYQKYLSEITKAANLYATKEISSEQAWADEIQRYYTYYEDRTYVKKYNDYCLGSIEVTPEAIVNAYTSDLNTQIQNFTVYDSYLETLTNSSNKDLVLYHAGGKSFSVQQIVLEFDDMISVTHNNSSIKVSEYLSSYLNNGYVFDRKDADKDDEKAYIDAREDYAINNPDSLNMTYIDPKTGLTTKDGKEIKKTYADFTAELNKIENEYTAKIDDLKIKYATEPVKYEAEKELADRAFVQEFYKLKFSYSKDGGVTDLTSLFNKVGYIFPEDRDDMTTSWVSEFSDAAYKLYDEYKLYGTFGVETFVSNYGVHVMIFAGETNAGQIAEPTIDSLESTLISYATTQTVADYYHDQILGELQTAKSTNASYYLQAMLGSSVSSVLYEKVSSVLYNQYFVDGKIEIKIPEYKDIA